MSKNLYTKRLMNGGHVRTFKMLSCAHILDAIALFYKLNTASAKRISTKKVRFAYTKYAKGLCF